MGSQGTEAKFEGKNESTKVNYVIIWRKKVKIKQNIETLLAYCILYLHVLNLKNLKYTWKINLLLSLDFYVYICVWGNCAYLLTCLYLLFVCICYWHCILMLGDIPTCWDKTYYILNSLPWVSHAHGNTVVFIRHSRRQHHWFYS